jgi:hypothetical protein
VVLGLGRLVPDSSSLVVAAATLAALFQPARRRLQQAVDRRFNRRRHDTAQTIAGFGTRLRDQVDLDPLTRDLLAVVDQTMQPTQASSGSGPRAHPWSGHDWLAACAAAGRHADGGHVGAAGAPGPASAAWACCPRSTCCPSSCP